MQANGERGEQILHQEFKFCEFPHMAYWLNVFLFTGCYFWLCCFWLCCFWLEGYLVGFHVTKNA